MRPMTRHKHTHTGLVTPQLPQLWLTAVLQLFAMLVFSVASTFQMKQLPSRRDWHTPDDEAALPRVKTDTLDKETQSVAASDTPNPHSTPACHPGSAQRYPGPIHPVGRNPQWFPALRFAAAGMTTIRAIEIEQHAGPHNLAPPHLRSSRRTSGPRASRVMCVETGPHQQPWIPACAGKSGFVNPPNKNTAA